MIRVVIFLVATVLLGLVSRRSLTSPGSHGFYRFFAWEAEVGLVLVNFVSFDQWFGEPLSAHQIVSWTLMFASLAVLFPALRLMKSRGRADGMQRTDGTLYAFEQTTELITSGVFGYIRHPMYASLLYLAWGVFFKRVSVFGAVLALAATGFLVLTALREEDENRAYFGPPYEDYRAETKMFVPFLF